MLYEVITWTGQRGFSGLPLIILAGVWLAGRLITIFQACVITSYSIHYTKLYEGFSDRHAGGKSHENKGGQRPDNGDAHLEEIRMKHRVDSITHPGIKMHAMGDQCIV